MNEYLWPEISWDRFSHTREEHVLADFVLAFSYDVLDLSIIVPEESTLGIF